MKKIVYILFCFCVVMLLGMTFSERAEAALQVEGNTLIIRGVYEVNTSITNQANKESIQNIVIDSSCATIGSRAFADFVNLKSVDIGEVLSIGDYAFEGCTSLTDVKIPNCNDIGVGIFSGCSSLKNISVPIIESYSKYIVVNPGEPESIKLIPQHFLAYYFCDVEKEMNFFNHRGESVDNFITYYSIENLNKKVVPKSLKTVTITNKCEIPDFYFSGCNGLYNIYFFNSIDNIGNQSFYNCTSLKEIILPDTISSIGEGAFYGCKNLLEILIPDNVTEIGLGALKNCTGLVSISIPFLGYKADGSHYLWNGLYEVNATHLGVIFGNLDDSNTFVPSSLKSIVIRGGTKINHDDINNLSGTNIESIEIPSSIYEIDKDNFGGYYGTVYCNNLYCFDRLNSSGIKVELLNHEYLTINNGEYIIHSALDDNKVLDISGNSKENRANIQIYKETFNEVQRFFLIKENEKRYYYFKSIYSEKYLDIRMPISSGSNVQLYDDNTSDEEKWFFEYAEEGYVYIRSMTGYYLTVQGGVASNNANVDVETFSGGKNQKWRLERFIHFGDLNLDDQINSDDAIYLLMHTQFPTDYLLPKEGDYDINFDSQINSDDAIYLLMHTQFPNDYPLLDKTNKSALINNTLYNSLDDALNAVKTGEVIKLVNNVKYDTSDRDIGRTKATVIDKKIVLDLNGHILSSEGKFQMFRIEAGGMLTLRDSVGTGKVVPCAGGYGGRFVTVVGGTFNLESGVITGGVSTSSNGAGAVNVGASGIFNMKGGRIENCKAYSSSSYNGGVAGAVAVAGTFNFSGGEITGCSQDDPNGANIEGAGTVNISGTALVNATYKVTTQNLTGGYYTKDVTADAAYGYKCVTDSTYAGYTHKIVVDPTINKVISVNGTEYYSFDEAMTAVAGMTGTISMKLLANVTQANPAYNTGNIVAGQSVTLDLNGYTLDGSHQRSIFSIAAGGTLTITDTSVSKTGLIKNLSASNSGAIATVIGTLYLNEGTLTGVTTGQGGAVRVWTGGTFNMTGGKITGSSAYKGGAVYVGGSTNAGYFYMTGGEIIANTTTDTSSADIYVTYSSSILAINENAKINASIVVEENVAKSGNQITGGYFASNIVPLSRNYLCVADTTYHDYRYKVISLLIQ